MGELKMQTNTLELLEWDSQFFGYPVARVFFDPAGIDNLDKIMLQIDAGKIHLTYFFVPLKADYLNNQISLKGGISVDQKTIFTKKSEPHSDFINSIIDYPGGEIDPRLVDLVLQAGSYSRFRIDSNFKNKEYEKLYITWLSNSLNKSIAFKTLVAKRKDDILGITTIGQKGKHADIGLVAVDENFRGQGIGYDLIHSADSIAFEMGFKEIKVVTQYKNRSACRLYEKCNFSIESITNIYHYWS